MWCQRCWGHRGSDISRSNPTPCGSFQVAAFFLTTLAILWSSNGCHRATPPAPVANASGGAAPHGSAEDGTSSPKVADTSPSSAAADSAASREPLTGPTETTSETPESAPGEVRPEAPDADAAPAPAPSLASAGEREPDPATAAPSEPPAANKPENSGTVTVGAGKALYSQHCAPCHGDRGDGQGPAARFLYPKPRDFRTGHFRLVSTNNNVPTLEDLDHVLVRGMPGSSMLPWAHLSKEQRQALAEYVLSLRAEGIREQFVRSLKDDEGLTDEEIASEDIQQEIQDRIRLGLTPGESSEVPAAGEATPESIARGKAAYIRLSCASCHGPEGKGDGIQKMLDDQNLPTSPRDFTRGIFKGGDDVASLYRRIAYGMPGTPMPSTMSATPEEMMDMVHYIRSLSTEEQRQAAVLKRAHVMVAKVDSLPTGLDAEGWSDIAPVALPTTLLWWRNAEDPQLHVQAVHDSRQIALRFTWHDATRNARATLPDEFEDMLAVEFSADGVEPFLGMGTADTQVDLWHWRGGMADAGVEDQILDDYPLDSPAYRAAARDGSLPDLLTARAVGNPLAQRQHAAGSLTAKGFGSLTFLPEPSQIISSEARWRDGEWTLVLTRPLEVNRDAGLALAPGRRYSVAFAVWDGAARDRAAQKAITVWNDLELQ